MYMYNLKETKSMPPLIISHENAILGLNNYVVQVND